MTKNEIAARLALQEERGKTAAWKAKAQAAVRAAEESRQDALAIVQAALAPMGGPKTPAIAVECMECGRKFTTRSLTPECARCGSVDVEVS